MSFTYTGYIIILLGLVAFFFSTRWLMAMTIFFIPFTATAVINIGDPGDGSAIQPYMFLLVMYIVRKNIGFILLRKFKPSPRIEFTDWVLVLFVAAVFLSLSMPLIIDGKITGNVTGRFETFEDIKFNNRNITQFLYFLLGVIFSFVIKNNNLTSANLNLSLKIYGYSLIFVLFWGLVDIACKKLNLPFPEDFFNNSVNPNAKGFKQVLEGDVNRIASVSVEPSVLAQSVVIYLPFLLLSLKRKVYIFSKIRDFLLLLALITFTFATTSFSGGVSVVFVFWVFVALSLKNSIQLLAFSIGTIFCIVVIYYYFFNNIIFSLAVNKVDSFSGLERIGTIYNGWENFLQYPILGVGWGSITVNDLFVKILSSSGIIATVFFLQMIIYIAIRHLSIISKNNENSEVLYYSESCLFSLIVLLFNSELNGFLHYFGMFWFILGLNLVNKKQITS